MKYLKIIGLAAVAAMALMAFAGSASADVVCKEKPNAAGECSTKAGSWGSGTTIASEASDPTLTVTGSSVGITSVTCTSSNVTLKTTSAGSQTPGVGVNGEVTSVKWNTCKTNEGLGCTVGESSGYTGALTATNDEGTGTLHVTGAKRTKVTCGFIFVCEYEPTSSGIDMHFTGGTTAKVSVTNAPLTLVSGGSGCGTEGKWDAAYSVTSINGTASKNAWTATKMD
jgi:hypothetical protein